MLAHCVTIDLANHGRRKARACFDGGRMSSDGGTLLLHATDQRICLTQRLTACFFDHCNPRRCEHSFSSLLALTVSRRAEPQGDQQDQPDQDRANARRPVSRHSGSP